MIQSEYSEDRLHLQLYGEHASRRWHLELHDLQSLHDNVL